MERLARTEDKRRAHKVLVEKPESKPSVNEKIILNLILKK
jgi:hypothetical protein